MVDSPASPTLHAVEPAAKSGASASAPKIPKGPPAAAAYVREDLSLRLENRDGDVLEVRRSVTVMAAYGRNAAACGRGCAESAAEGGMPGVEGAPGLRGRDGSGAAGAADAGEERGPLSEALKWAREVARELEKQQARLIEALLKRNGGDDASAGGFLLYSVVLAKAEADPEAEVEAMDEEYGVPEYWNAENTSDRIVAFATSFAGIFGDDPEFAETLVGAVAEGFAQADAFLGELPGKAGKLNRDTRDKVFEKLDNWLAAWKAGAYNVEAQPEAPEPALPA